MSNQGEEPLTRRGKVITTVGVTAVVAVIAATGIWFASAAHAAQVKADAAKAMTAAAPAYAGAISLGGDLDQLAAKSVQAKAAYDAEQERLAAEKAAQEAEAAQAAAEAAARAAAEEAARQAEQQAAADDDSRASDAPTGGDAPAAPVRCPAGSQANSSDGVNDTSCFPVICFTISVPDPAHPECDVAFKP